MKTPHGVCPDTEAWLPLPNGGVFAFPSAASSPEGADYVRVLDQDGGEIGYWTADEWAEAPVEVMGAICGSLLSDEAPTSPKYYQFGPNTTFPHGIHFEEYES